MKIGIIGGGTVGRATARAFIEHVDEVRVFDVVKERRTHFLRDVLAADLIFVCLPTPQKPDSLECDLSAVDKFFFHVQTEVLGTISEVGWCSRNFVLRSTVPIGTTKRLSQQYNLLNLVHSPEFLTARCSVIDAHLPSRNIIGIPREVVPLMGCAFQLWQLYEKRFPGVPCIRMRSGESEAVKLFTNGFFATKIAYWNEVNKLAMKLGLDWERVMDGVLSDGRIAHSHTQVPGPDGKYGFGGECLVKDLNSLVSQLIRHCNDSLVTASVGLRNKEDRKRT